MVFPGLAFGWQMAYRSQQLKIETRVSVIISSEYIVRDINLRLLHLRHTGLFEALLYHNP
jgi:hypothetical protein